jgi:hypothetical protein
MVSDWIKDNKGPAVAIITLLLFIISVGIFFGIFDVAIEWSLGIASVIALIGLIVSILMIKEDEEIEKLREELDIANVIKSALSNKLEDTDINEEERTWLEESLVTTESFIVLVEELIVLLDEGKTTEAIEKRVTKNTLLDEIKAIATAFDDGTYETDVNPSSSLEDDEYTFETSVGTYDIPTSDGFIKQKEAKYMSKINKDLMIHGSECFKLGNPFNETSCSGYSLGGVETDEIMVKQACLDTNGCYAYSITKYDDDDTRYVHFFTEETVNELELNSNENSTTSILTLG